MGTDSIPVAAGEPARLMIKAWAEAHGMVLYQGREGDKYPMRRWPKNAGYPCWEYVPWSGIGPAITQIHPFLGILDADDREARERVDAMGLPPHFATRGVSYHKQVVTEHHYLALVGRPKRIVGMTPGLDFLSNPDNLELFIKVWDEGYEVLSVQPGHPVPQIPDHLIELHHRAEEEQRQRKAADGAGVPVERYRAEGIPSGHQSEELWASACNLAARRFQPAGILSVLGEIVEHSVLTKGPWQERTLASMADRAYRRYGKPPIVVREVEEDLDPALYPADQDQEQVQEQAQEPELNQKPEQKPEDLSRHVTTPRLRVAPPAELAEWADRVIKDVLAPIWKVTYPARPADPGAEGAQWGDMDAAMAAVDPAAEVLGWLGDLEPGRLPARRCHHPLRRPANRVHQHPGNRPRGPGRSVRRALPGRLEQRCHGGLRGPGQLAIRPGRLASAVPSPARGHRGAPAAGPGGTLAGPELRGADRRPRQCQEVAGPLWRPDPVRRWPERPG